jgi:hypothetical protein
LINDHIHAALAKHHLDHDQPKESLALLLKLLHNSKTSPNIQRAYLAEFVHLYQSFVNANDSSVIENLMDKIPIPSINDSSIKLSVEQKALTTVDDGADAKFWNELESQIVDHVSKTQSKRSMQKNIVLKDKIECKCAIGGKNFGNYRNCDSGTFLAQRNASPATTE